MGCRPTTSKTRRSRSWRTARRRPTWGWRCWRTSRRVDLGYLGRRECASHRARARHDGKARALLRPLSQLVRHQDAAAAAAALRLHRRQRQLGGHVDDPGARVSGDDATAAADDCQRDARHPPAGRGRGRSPARRRSGARERKRCAPGSPCSKRAWRTCPATTIPRAPGSPRSGRGGAGAAAASGSTIGGVVLAGRPTGTDRVASRRGADRSPRAQSALRRHRAARVAAGRGHGLPLSVSPRARQVFTIGYDVAAERARPIVLRSPGQRGAARQLRGHRQRRRAGQALVPPGAPVDARGRTARAPVVDRHHVRVPHAGAAHAQLSRHAPRRVAPGGRRQADRVRPRTTRAVGHLRERVQRARSEPQLSVRTLRRARARHQARSGRGPSGGAVRHGAGAPRRAARRRRESVAPAGRRARRAVRLLRVDRLHAVARPRRSARRRSPDLHGPSPGHEPDRAVRRAGRLFAHGDALCQRPARQSDRAPPRGAGPLRHAARRGAGRHQPPSRSGARGGQRRVAPVFARRRARRAPALERQLLRHGERGRRRLQRGGAIWPSPAGAKIRRATPGGSSFTCATCTTITCGRPRTNRR